MLPPKLQPLHSRQNCGLWLSQLTPGLAAGGGSGDLWLCWPLASHASFYGRCVSAAWMLCLLYPARKTESLCLQNLYNEHCSDFQLISSISCKVIFHSSPWCCNLHQHPNWSIIYHATLIAGVILHLGSQPFPASLFPMHCSVLSL